MKTKNLVVMAFLIAIGATCYVIVPGFIGGMKPDFMITMMFVAMFFFRDAKSTFLLALTTGLLSGLFSTFPGGFVPNVIDKFVTAFIIFAVIRLVGDYAKNRIVATTIAGIGTMISGSIFLALAMFVLGANVGATYFALFIAVVLPTALLSAAAFFIVYPIVGKVLRQTSFQSVFDHS